MKSRFARISAVAALAIGAVALSASLSASAQTNGDFSGVVPQQAYPVYAPQPVYVPQPHYGNPHYSNPHHGNPHYAEMMQRRAQVDQRQAYLQQRINQAAASRYFHPHQIGYFQQRLGIISQMEGYALRDGRLSGHEAQRINMAQNELDAMLTPRPQYVPGHHHRAGWR